VLQLSCLDENACDRNSNPGALALHAGVWAGVGLAYCVAYMPQQTTLLRFLMLAIFIGGIARAVGMTGYDVIERKVIIGTVIDLVVPVVVVFLQAKAIRS
jgi:hypothetical protein